jgi:hypothetical protein
MPVVARGSRRIPLVVEKTAFTFIQAFLAALLIDWNDSIDISKVNAAILASIPAALTAFGAYLPNVPEHWTYGVALVGNIVRTFVVTFVGYLLALDVFSLDRSVLTAAMFAAAASALAALKGVVAAKVGDPATPNLTDEDVRVNERA